MYGKNPKSWPRWVRFSVKDTQKEINRDRRHDHWTLFDDDADDTYPSERGNGAIEAAWDYIEETRPDDHDDGMVWVPLSFSDGLRYSPYPDEATNREYRRANGIKERKA